MTCEVTRHAAVSAVVAVGLLVAGIIVGAAGYYVATNQIKTVTEVQTTTQFSTITQTQTSISILSATVSTTTTTVTLPVSSSYQTSSSTAQYAVLNTSQGTIVIELFPQSAPKTVANFVSLANSGFYNDLVWHRIVAGFIIQTGDPNTRNAGGDENTWGQGGSGTTIPFENTGLPEDVGYVAMANTSPQGNGASSQFFINLVNNTSVLDNGYAVFGQVVQGLSVVDAIGNLPVASTCQSSGGLQCPPANPQEALLISVVIQNSP